MNILHFIIALTPVLLVLLLLVILRLPATRAMPLSWLIHALLAFVVWRMPLLQITAASLEGVIIAASVLWIIFGAIFLLNILKSSGAFHTLRQGFTRITADRRVQAILIAWLFGTFLEGAAGFGTPAAICAPLLVAIGFPPLAAVVLALISNSVAVTYGGVGTTFLVGLTQGLQQGGTAAPMVSLFLSSTPLTEFTQSVSVKAALINIVPGVLLPLLLSVMLTRFWGAHKSWREGLDIWKFALLTGFLTSTFSAAFAYFFGPEFPSLIGSLLAMLILIPLAAKGILLPKQAWVFESDGQEVSLSLQQPASPPLWKAVSPYILVPAILVITRLRFLPFKQLLNSVQVGWAHILGTDISTSFAPLYSPGAIFVAASLLSVGILGINRRQLGKIVGASARNLIPSAIALGTAVPLVRIFINSGVNTLGTPSMPIELAAAMAVTLGPVWTFISPFIGALGAFISGSATFSNLMFGLFQFSAAVENGLQPTTILALQTVGAALGNMICVVNVVAASSVVGLQGKEGKIIRYTLLPSLGACLLAGIIAVVLWK